MNLVAYGTLMSPDIMEEVSGCSLDSVDVYVAGYQRYTVRGEQYPGMIREAGGRVAGVMYLDVPEEAVARLDIFEGDMYCRLPIKVERAGDGVVVEAMVYIVKPEHEHLLTRNVWDYQHFLEYGKKLFAAQYTGFSDLEE